MLRVGGKWRGVIIVGKELLDLVEFLVHNVEVFCLHSWVGGIGRMGVGVGWRKEGGREGRREGRKKEREEKSGQLGIVSGEDGKGEGVRGRSRLDPCRVVGRVGLTRTRK